MKTLIESVSKWAIEKHDIEANHKYGDRPYSTHLRHVYEVAKRFSHLIPEIYHDVVFAACWLHDAIEDARVTYNDIKNQYGKQVADIVYACTNEKGRTRKERANANYYQCIRETQFAPFVKLCDRIANVESAQKNNNALFLMYQKENDEFLYNINRMDDEMANYLSSLFLEL